MQDKVITAYALVAHLSRWDRVPDPIEYVAQTVLEFSTRVLCESGDGEIILRDSYADYRVHALAPDAETVEVVPGAMTRVAAPGSKLANISSGGKMKDTWVLA